MHHCFTKMFDKGPITHPINSSIIRYSLYLSVLLIFEMTIPVGASPLYVQCSLIDSRDYQLLPRSGILYTLIWFILKKLFIIVLFLFFIISYELNFEVNTLKM